MDGLTQHGAVFQRLLFDRSFRAAVRKGDSHPMGPVAGAFKNIDLDELELLAQSVRNGLLKGTLGGLGIGPSFPATLTALGGTAEDAVDRYLADAGVAPPHVDATGRRAGVSVLESFYCWAIGELSGDAPACCQAQHELAAGLLAAMARHPRPGFRVDWPLLHRGDGGWYAVLDAQRPLSGPSDPPELSVVHVAVNGRYARGRVSPTLAAVVLCQAHDPPSWAREGAAQLDGPQREAVHRALAARGLA